MIGLPSSPVSSRTAATKQSGTDRIALLAITEVIYILLVLAAGTLFTHPSQAASFPCDRAISARERLICGNPTLSRADERLSVSYRAALAAVSKEGRAAFRQSEQQWLQFTETVCSIDHPPTGDAQRLSTGADCLANEYAARERQLHGAVVRRGGLVIRRVDRFEVVLAPADEGSGGAHPGFSTTMIAYPQIDLPRNGEEMRWNELMSKWGDAAAGGDAGGPEDTGHDLLIDYTLGIANRTVISVMRDAYDDWHGAHGSADDKGITWLIGEGRALRPEDLFDPRRHWVSALAHLVFDRALAESRREHRPFGVPPASGLEASVGNPAHWLLTKPGLEVRLDPRDLGYDDPDVIDVEVPWRALAPYFSHTTVVSGLAE